jgi:hypothetical protein
VLGNGLRPAAAGVDFASGGIIVDARPLSFAVAAQRFETGEGIRVRRVVSVRIGGYSGRRYSLMLHRPVSLQGILGYAVVLEPGEPDIILLGVRPQRTLVIRRSFDQDIERPEIERIIMSLEVPH